MSRIFKAYRAIHQQGFIPIFVNNGFDSRMLVEACIEAGCKAIEYTLRRKDAHRMIPQIREHYPDLYLLVGSTIDDERIVRRMRGKYPQLLTLSEIEEYGVDGFVSMLGYSLESIRRYSKDHIVIPTAMTVTEALQQVGAGAHFIKLSGSDLDFVRRLRSDATFGFCPTFVTGGMTPERIPEAISAGAVMVAAGFDLLLKDKPENISQAEVVRIIKEYLEVTRLAREKQWPEMLEASEKDRQIWLGSLPHYHPF
jgi:2-keto-3-deoxy-6-phosphogluconate aldolase